MRRVLLIMLLVLLTACARPAQEPEPQAPEPVPIPAEEPVAEQPEPESDPEPEPLYPGDEAHQRYYAALYWEGQLYECVIQEDGPWLRVPDDATLLGTVTKQTPTPSEELECTCFAPGTEIYQFRLEDMPAYTRRWWWTSYLTEDAILFAGLDDTARVLLGPESGELPYKCQIILIYDPNPRDQQNKIDANTKPYPPEGAAGLVHRAHPVNKRQPRVLYGKQ